ncbi:MAG: hypothetical protein HYW25_05900 [Candidatus Aenigmarchaeota archaeon]|nr:hypothetical protein [Candidatus Aenigmarchaeota archaeon]
MKWKYASVAFMLLLIAALIAVPNQTVFALQEYDTAEVEGRVIIIHSDDFISQHSENAYYLESGEGDFYRLVFRGDPLLIPDSIIRIRGKISGQQISVDGENLVVIRLPEPDPADNNLRVLVIMFNFINDQRKPYLAEQINYTLFEGTFSPNNFFQENSFGKVSLSGDVIGWYTIDNTNDVTCDYGLWSQAAEELAAKDNYDVNNYDRVIYFFPSSEVCNWAGRGQLGGDPPRKIWINGENWEQLYAHEIGHTFSLHHSGSLDCGFRAIDDYANCIFSEQGDSYDVMGNRYHHLNAPHKIAAGWISPESVQEIAKSGIYTIYFPLEAQAFGTQVLKIAKPDTNEHYFLEYRRPIGFDDLLSDAITEGTLIHVWDGISASKTKLIDATPKTKKYAYDEALSDGSLFYDRINRISITQLRHDEDSVTIYVAFLPPPCYLCDKIGPIGLFIDPNILQQVS